MVKISRELAEIQPDNMERVRQDVLFAWNKARVYIGPIPRDQNRKVLKHLQTCFSSRDIHVDSAGIMRDFNRNWMR